METRQLLENYYNGLRKKQGWEDTVAEDFKFTGGDMITPQVVTGKAGYIAVIARFSRLFTDLRTMDILINGDRAFVLANYDYVFPNGTHINGNVAEYWKIKDDKLSELTIFFDTAGFATLTKPA